MIWSKYKGYTIEITDLPGTYALSAYSPEEKYVRQHLEESTPDVVVNTIVASNLERNLYLTTELIDISPKMVIALNMYDELERSGAKFDHEALSSMIGIPMVPIVDKIAFILIRSTTPLKFSSAPIGITIGHGFAPKTSFI